MNEATILNLVRLTASRLGAVLFRNNIGAVRTSDGRHIKYGVCNPGGSDLIGFKKIKITQDMVGKDIAVFTAIEVKSQDGIVSKDQKNFIDVVSKAGGISGVARSEVDAQTILNWRGMD